MEGIHHIRANSITNNQPKNIEQNPYKRNQRGKSAKVNKIMLNKENDEDEVLQRFRFNKNNNRYNDDIKKSDRLNIFLNNFLNKYEKKDSNERYKNNYSKNDNFHYWDFLAKKEIATKHADSIPESVCNRLFDSIVNIVLYSGMATGFLMKIKINHKEMKCLFTCFHVISDEDIKNKIKIDIYYGKKTKNLIKKFYYIQKDLWQHRKKKM